jgi:hypothetical protein
MSESLATWILTALGAYATAGCVFAPFFVWKGAASMDPVAASGSMGFRLLILPGCALLWPWLFHRWLQREGRRVEDSPHRRAALAFSTSTASRTALSKPARETRS